MKKINWERTKMQLTKAVKKGAKLLQGGGEKAIEAAERTAHALKVSSEIHGIKSRLAKLDAVFGREVHRAMKDGSVRITNIMRKVNAEIGHLERAIKNKEREVHRALAFKSPLRKAAKRKILKHARKRKS